MLKNLSASFAIRALSSLGSAVLPTAKGATLEEHMDKEANTEKNVPEPYRIRLPGFIQEEVGLGDVIKRVTYAMGIQPCQGCEKRASALNRWAVFSPRTRGRT